MSGKRIAAVCDPSNHGGFISSSNQDETLLIGNVNTFGEGNFGDGTFGAAIVAVNGASHSCPMSGHGVRTITAITRKSKHNSKLILTSGAEAGCGAKMSPANRSVYVE